MSYDVLLASRFKREIKRLSKKFISLKFDFEELLTSLEATPLQGVALGNDCYKIRLAIRSKGRGMAVVQD